LLQASPIRYCAWPFTGGPAARRLFQIAPFPTLPPHARRPTMRGAVAGSLLVATILLCAAIGFGLGALVGAPVALGLAGLFAGVPLGIVVVIRRFRDL
jgi:hypothetical protein